MGTLEHTRTNVHSTGTLVFPAIGFKRQGRRDRIQRFRNKPRNYRYWYAQLVPITCRIW